MLRSSLALRCGIIDSCVSSEEFAPKSRGGLSLRKEKSQISQQKKHGWDGQDRGRMCIAAYQKQSLPRCQV